MADKASNTIAFQGLPGAYSELASRLAYPRMRTLPTAAFEDTFAAAAIETRYYSPAVHVASFALPGYIEALKG